MFVLEKVFNVVCALYSNMATQQMHYFNDGWNDTE